MLSTLRSHVKVIRRPEPSQWYRSLHTAIPSLSDIGSDAPLFDKILVVRNTLQRFNLTDLTAV